MQKRKISDRELGFQFNSEDLQLDEETRECLYQANQWQEASQRTTWPSPYVPHISGAEAIANYHAEIRYMNKRVDGGDKQNE